MKFHFRFSAKDTCQRDGRGASVYHSTFPATSSTIRLYWSLGLNPIRKFIIFCISCHPHNLMLSYLFAHAIRSMPMILRIGCKVCRSSRSILNKIGADFAFLLSLGLLSEQKHVHRIISQSDPFLDSRLSLAWRSAVTFPNECTLGQLSDWIHFACFRVGKCGSETHDYFLGKKTPRHRYF